MVSDLELNSVEFARVLSHIIVIMFVLVNLIANLSASQAEKVSK